MTDARVLVSRPVAHRGLHNAAAGVLENTLAAARAAVDKGFAIECDVQRSADGEAMVFHDFDLERLVGRHGFVADHKAADLADMVVTGGADKVPTLQDLLDAIAGRVPLIVEIKSAFRGDLRLAKRTVDLLLEYRGPVGIKSFDPAMLIEAKKLAAGKIPCGIVAMQDYSYFDYEPLNAADKHALANLLHFPQSKPDFISWKVDDLPCAAPFLCRSELGLPLMSWTVRTPEQRARAAAHADQMVFEHFVP